MDQLDTSLLERGEPVWLDRSGEMNEVQALAFEVADRLSGGLCLRSGRIQWDGPQSDNVLASGIFGMQVGCQLGCGSGVDPHQLEAAVIGNYLRAHRCNSLGQSPIGNAIFPGVVRRWNTGGIFRTTVNGSYQAKKSREQRFEPENTVPIGTECSEFHVLV